MCPAPPTAAICVDPKVAERASHPHDPLHRRRRCHGPAAGAAAAVRSRLSAGGAHVQGVLRITPTRAAPPLAGANAKHKRVGADTLSGLRAGSARKAPRAAAGHCRACGCERLRMHAMSGAADAGWWLGNV